MRLRQAAILIKTAAALSVAIVTGGCWDKVDLQEVGYVTAMGVDYKDGQFELYGEMVGFGSVAKTEAPANVSQSLKWIGHSQGETMFAAISKLIKSSQYQLSWDNLKSLVIHERAMVKLEEMLDALNRQRASRFTVWIFGTRGDIGQLFETDTIFNQSPLVSSLYAPDITYKQVSELQPLTMQRFIQQMNEESYTTVLMNLTTDSRDWKQGRKPLKLDVARGSFLLRNRSLICYMTDSELRGLRWAEPKFRQEMLPLRVNGKWVTAAIDNVDYKMHGNTQGKSARFRLIVKILFHMVEVDGQTSHREIEREVSRVVQAEIEHTYKAALKKHADIFQTRLNLYRYHTAYWKKYAKGEAWVPDPDALTVKVSATMTHSGKYDLN